MQTIQKSYTSKKGCPCVIITLEDDRKVYVVRNDRGELKIFDSTATNDSWGNTKDVFDEKPFIDFYEKYVVWKKEELAAKIEAAKVAEEKRINEIRGRILKCNSPIELAEEFFGSIKQVAAHWSGLHNGNNWYAVGLNSEDVEVMDMAISIHNIEGEYGELMHRAGENYNTFSEFRDLNDYQEAIHGHFNGDEFFFRSQESVEDITLDRVKEAETLDEVIALIKDYDELEVGYYDCNGNLEILERDLDSPNLTGYSHDVYNRYFGYCFAHKNKFNNLEDEDEVEDE